MINICNWLHSAKASGTSPQSLNSPSKTDTPANAPRRQRDGDHRCANGRQHAVLPPIPSVLYNPFLPLFKGKFWTLTGRKVGPLLLFVLIETAEEGHVAIERTKLGERDRAMERVNDAGIELAHHIEHPNSRLIEISSADIPGIGE